jgi:glycine/D-amino acid oxidase-like deaminating enzyme
MPDSWNAVIVGGGFFGCVIARHLAARMERIAVLEERPDLLQRASYHNQARVHNGYHYPRSLLTALRSRINFPRFVRDFEDCIVQSFDKYYAIARQFSKVSADYFSLFCRRIGAFLRPAPTAVRRLFDPHTIEEVFAVQEYAFDAVKLKERMKANLLEAGVHVELNTSVRTIQSGGAGRLELHCDSPSGVKTLEAGQVFNCTYSQINPLLERSGIAPLPLKQELAEMALVEVPDELKNIGVTVMCGPFFSCMPFPARGLHSLSHVRYTPHRAWQEGPNHPSTRSRSGRADPGVSNVHHMMRDAARYLPSLAACRYQDSLWEVKTVLPASEGNDSRPILFQQNVGLANLHCVMGGKIDNIYDVTDAIDDLLAQGRSAA